MYYLILYLEIVVFQHEYTEFIEYLCGKLSQNVMKRGTNARDSSLTSDNFLVLTPSFPAVAPMTISRAGAQGAVSAAGNKMADGGRF